MSGRKRVRRSQKKNPTEVAKIETSDKEKPAEVVKIVTSGESFEVGTVAQESSRSSSVRSTSGIPLNLKPSGEKSEVQKVELKKSTSLRHTSVRIS